MTHRALVPFAPSRDEVCHLREGKSISEFRLPASARRPIQSAGLALNEAMILERKHALQPLGRDGDDVSSRVGPHYRKGCREQRLRRNRYSGDDEALFGLGVETAA